MTLTSTRSRLAEDHIARMARLWPAKVATKYVPPEPIPEPKPMKPPRPVIPERYTLEEILLACVVSANITREDFDKPGKWAALARVRHVYFYLARQLTTKGYAQIARMAGGRTKITARHGANKVKASLEEYADAIEAAKQLLVTP